MKHFKSLLDLHRENGFPPPEHPLFSVVSCKLADACPIGDREFTSDFYMIALKKFKAGVILYGRTKYDNNSGSMYFVQPRQVIEMKNLETEEDGFMIFCHEDFLNGLALHSEIKKYGFFDYEINEALHLSPKEEAIIWELYNKIENEYRDNPDEYSRDIILAHFDSILKYSQRFYKRQFINRTTLSGSIVSRFNHSLKSYFDKGLDEKGLPTVKGMAEELNLSSRYLSDVLKQETGKTAIELIHIFLISEAKNLIRSSENNIADTAYALGFDNLPYFSRLFKRETGMSPNQFKKQLLN